MTGIWHSRNFWRLFITYGLLVVSSIGVLGTVLVDRVEQSFVEQARDNLRRWAVVARENVRTMPKTALALPEQAEGSLKNHLEQLRQSAILHIAFFDADGKLLIDSERNRGLNEGDDYSWLPEVQAARSKVVGVARRQDSEFSNKEMMYLALALVSESPVGVVRVGLPLDTMEQQLDGMRTTVWTTAGVTAGVALLLAFWLAQRTAKPLQELTRGAELIAAGQFGHKVKAVSQDEVGTLARTFNRMSEHLAEQFAQLQRDTAELRRLEGLRRDFVANVSHELKTPLAVIKASVETLLDGAADDLQVRGAFLQQVAEQADHLEALIYDLLSLARVETGAEVFEFQPVALGEAALSCLDRHRARAEATQKLLEAVAPPHDAAAPVTAWADEEAVSQILDNLVDNALKYTPPGGQIRLRWWGDNGQASFEVADTGVGIPEADLPRVFERFYRVDKARSRELGGTGLGLAIVKHLAQAMRGSVYATSHPGQGSTFTVRLSQVETPTGRRPAVASSAGNQV